MTRALVINLDRSPARWAASSKALEEAGFAVERVAAVDARRQPSSDRYDRAANARSYFAPLKPAEIACFRSHRRAWERVAADGPALVCEDDVAVDDDLLALVEALPDGVAAAKFYSKRSVGGPSVPLRNRRLVRPRIVPLGCVAVWLTPAAARKLLAASQRFHEPVDVFAQRVWAHGVATHVVQPPPVREVSARLGGSTLLAPRPSAIVRFAREFRRPVFRTRLALHSLWKTR